MVAQRSLSNSESTALSMVRVFAMILIISCHIAQCYNLQIAYILNVGVQIFFFMSGFLYGKQEQMPSVKGFYLKRFVRVYLPYFVILAIVLVIYAIFHLTSFTFKQVLFYLLSLQWFVAPIEGLNHLWFLTVLMFGYLLTPWIHRVMDKAPIVCALFFVCCCVVEFVFLKKFYSLSAWLALYLLGLFYGKYHSKTVSVIALVASSIALIVFCLFFEPSKLTSFEARHYMIWLHWILGVFLFVLLYYVLPLLIGENKSFDGIKHLDKISYEVYLIHHPLILGPLSLMFVTKVAGLNIVLMLVVVYLLARALNNICSFTKKLV